VYILATTEHHKVLPTVRSRCLNFHLQPPSGDDLLIYLQNLCHEQNVAYDSPLLKGIVDQAQGSYRDLLNIYQHALLIGEGSLKDPVLYEMLAVIDPLYWEQFFQAFHQLDLTTLRTMLRMALKKMAPDLLMRQMFSAILTQTVLDESSKISLYAHMSEFPRLSASHPDISMLFEILLIKACIESDVEIEKKKS
jgi:DNA polymerase III gamma/tau subunit